MKVSVITATIGKSTLAECIASVREQTYKDIEHIVVVDGKSRWEQAEPILRDAAFPRGESSSDQLIVLPYPTGTDRYNGHRIYGALSYLSSGEYIMWLDDDNILEPDHIESLVKVSQENKLDWAYSLRKIIDEEGKFICNDDCESLGTWKSVINDNFVDVNCFFVRRNLAVSISPIWYRQARQSGVMEVDRALTQVLMHPNNNLKFDTNGDYTLRYRVGSTGISVQTEFFIKGNAEMLKRYGGNLPWKQ